MHSSLYRPALQMMTPLGPHLQDPVLTSLEVRLPTWQELGGARLVEAAAAARAPDVLRKLAFHCDNGIYGLKGPYAFSIGELTLLRAYSEAGEWGKLAPLVSVRGARRPAGPCGFLEAAVH